MNKKLLILLVILFLVAGGLVGLYLMRSQQGSGGASFWGNFFGGGQNQPPTTNNPPTTFPPDNTPVSTSTSPEVTITSLFDKSGLTLLANGFVSGATFVGDSKIHYATRDTGNLFTLDIASGTTARYSNIIVPGSYATQFSNDGKVALISSNERGVVGYSILTTIGTSTRDAILPNTITRPRLSPDGTKMVYIEDLGDSARIRIRSLTTKNPDTTAYSSALRDIAAEWVSSTTLLVHTKASYRKDSTAFLISTSGTGISEVTTPMRGLTALAAPTGSRVLIGSVSVEGELLLSVFERGESTTLPVRTLPEKCVWSRVTNDVLYCAVPVSLTGSTLPDAWWKGDVSFNDELWKFNIKEGSAVRIYENTNMDIMDLSLSIKDNLLLFRNKKNASLWAFNLTK